MRTANHADASHVHPAANIHHSEDAANHPIQQTKPMMAQAIATDDIRSLATAIAIPKPANP